MAQMPFTTPLAFVGAASLPDARTEAPSFWFVFSGDKLLVEIGPPDPRPGDDPRVRERPSWARVPLLKNNNPLWSDPVRTLYLGGLAGTDCWAAEVTAAQAPPGHGWVGLRALFSVLEDAHFALAGRAIQLLDWDRCHQYCGRCGTPTQPRSEERVRVCPACRLSAYPRVAPAVMALVTRGRELLLGRSPHFPQGMYSALAGFVEPGETLEQCAAREVAEEVGVTVTNLSYFASQPWPFPHSLMLAFVCDWAGGEIRAQEGEIETADWFDVLQLPKLPSKISIARRLIDAVASDLRRKFETGA
jgi:NAD+ diphosphatase